MKHLSYIVLWSLKQIYFSWYACTRLIIFLKIGFADFMRKEIQDCMIFINKTLFRVNSPCLPSSIIFWYMNIKHQMFAHFAVQGPCRAPLMTSVIPRPTRSEPAVFIVPVVLFTGMLRNNTARFKPSLAIVALATVSLSAVCDFCVLGEHNHDWSLTKWVQALCTGLKDSCKHPWATALGDDVCINAQAHT